MRKTNLSFPLRDILLNAFSVCLFLLLFAVQAKAEGTTQAMPTNLNGTALLCSPATGAGPLLNAATENRIKFHIADHVNEFFFFGLHPRQRIPSTGVPVNGYYRIIDPTGTVVVGPVPVPTAGAGFIPNYAQGFAGPNIGGLNPTGYTPATFDPLMNGDYYIEIYKSNTGGATMVTGNSGEMYFPYFDFTVALANNTVFPGRVNSQKWAFVTYNPGSASFQLSLSFSFEGNYYAYTQDSSVVVVDFQPGFRPLGYILSMTYYGVANTGNFATDRVSVYTGTSAPALLGGYPVFLNAPDPAVFTRSASAGAPAITSNVFGCPGAFFIPFFIDKPGDIAILLDLNNTGAYEPGSADVVLEQFGLAAGNHVLGWNGLDGFGVPVAGGISVAITVVILRGRTNIPIYDAEMNQNGFSANVISPTVGNRRLFWDDASLAPVGTCPIGSGATAQNTNNSTAAGVAETTPFGGILGPTHAWDGGATFAVPAPILGIGSATNVACDDYGNARTVNTWFWANEVASAPISRVLPDCDHDGDGILDAIDIDDDNDGIPDLDESGGIDPDADVDGDGVPNYLDPDFPGFVDSNFDGVNDNFDTDLDGVINSRDIDSDDDGIADGVEANGGTIPVGFDNTTGTFTGPVGANGMPDSAEQGGGGSGVSILSNPDTDGDSTPDAYDIDSDNDGIPDMIESQTGGTIILPTGTDADGNGRDDAFDGVNSITPTDLDGDGVPDYLDLDTDNDGIPDITESGNGNFDNDNDGTIDSVVDVDGDGLMDVVDGTNNNSAGGFVAGGPSDVIDITNLNNPNNDVDLDNDGLPNWADLDADGDGIPDITESGNGALDIDNDGTIDSVTDIDGDGLIDVADGVNNSLLGGFVAGSSSDVIDNDDLNNANNDIDADNDGIPNFLDLDSDNDGIPDLVETGNGAFDTDNDGIIDSAVDIDNDGLADVVDGVNNNGAGGFLGGLPTDVIDNDNLNNASNDLDADNDGFPNYLDLDADNDGIPDLVESGNGNLDGNNDGIIDSVVDVDGDGLADVADGVNNNGAGGFTAGAPTDVVDNNNLNNASNDLDADNDGVANFLDLDSDNDGIADILETSNGNFDVNNDGMIDSAVDADADGLADVADGFNNNGAGGFVAGGAGDVFDSNNLNNASNDVDLDNDGFPNYLDLDADNDGIADLVETDNGGFDANNDGMIDSATDVDGDGLIDVADGVNNNGAGGFTAGGAGDVIDNDNLNNPANDLNADNDGLPNFLDLDSDNDGIADITETLNGNFDANNDGMIDSPTDADADGLQDVVDGVNNNGAGGFVAGNAADVIDNDNLNNPANDVNLDNDGFPNYLDLDADGDGIADLAESLNGTLDANNDGVIDSAVDVDNDGLVDVVDGVNNNGAGGFVAGNAADVIDNDNLNAAANDVNGDADALPNFLDLDADGDGIPDIAETSNGSLDANNDGVIDSATDADADGLADVADGVNNNGAGGFVAGGAGDVIDNDNFNNAANDINHDADNFPDFLDIDSDGDGIVDLVETNNGNLDADNDGAIDAGTDVDADGLADAVDGVNNNGAGGFVAGAATDVIDNDNINNTSNDIDLDNDGLPSYLDLDADGDGVADVAEVLNGSLDANNDGLLDVLTDVDGDGLADIADGVNNNGAGGFVAGATGDVIDNNNLSNPLNDVNGDADAFPNFLDLDADGDGIPDIAETSNGNLDVNNDGVIDNAVDADGDGLMDIADGVNNNGAGGFVAGAAGDVIVNNNFNAATNDINADADANPDFLDIDADGDGIADIVETNNGNLDATNDGSVDAGTDVDADGLADAVDGVNNNGAGGFVAGAATDVIDNDNINNTNNDIDLDNDGLPSYLDLDADGDGVADIAEVINGSLDANNDGLVDNLTDADGDGLADIADGVNNNGAGGFVAGGVGDVIDNNNLSNPLNDVNADADIFPNFLDLDADGDGIPDIAETNNGTLDANNDGVIDFTVDADNDGLADAVDGVNNNGAGGFVAGAAINVIVNNDFNAASNDINTDADANPDFLDIDADNDGIADIVEAGNGNFDGTNDGSVDAGADADADGLTDVVDGFNNNGAVGFVAGAAADVNDNDNINNAANDIDWDNDGIANHLDLDADGDGIPDVVESMNGPFDATNDGTLDSAIDIDGDGLADVADGVNNNGAVGFVAGAASDVIDNNNLSNGANNVNADDGSNPNFLDLDADDDGIADIAEVLNGALDIDNNGMVDNLVDADADGITDATDDFNNNGAGGFVAGAASDVIDNNNLNAAANDVNADLDMWPNFLDVDADNDGISDIAETNNSTLDANNDGRVDSPVDADSDGLKDFADDVNNNGAGGFVAGSPADVIDNDDFEVAVNDINKDVDPLPNFLDLDSDNDGIADVNENTNGVTTLDLGGGAVLDGMVGNAGITDANNDGWDDAAAGSTVVDFDLDGLGNYVDIDADNDGIADYHEGVCTACINAGGVALPTGPDANGNGIIDSYDNINGTNNGGGTNNGVNPYNHETTGLPDFVDLDADDDTYPDWTEGFDVNCTTDAWDDILADAAAYEAANGNPGNYPLLPDTDGDMVPDWLDNTPTQGAAFAIRSPYNTFGNAAYIDANNNGLIDIYDPLMNGTLSTTPNCDALADDDFRDVNTQTLLPIEFLSNRAVKVDEQVKVSWIISSDIGLSHFDVERKLPTENDFNHVGTVAASGQNGAFEMFDAAPAMGLNNYRIKVVDIDGAVTYSTIMSVTFDGSSSITVGPNPVVSGQNLTIRWELANGESLSNAQMFDIQGRKIMEINLDANSNGSEVLDLSNVSSGEYLLLIGGENLRKTFRITRQ